MKYSILILSSILVMSSCSLFKKKQCTEINVTTEQAEMVQANPGNSMYTFRITEGELSPVQVNINVMDEGREKDAFLMKEGDSRFSSAVNKESWSWKEDINMEEMTVQAKGTVQIQYGKKVYCVNVSYEGPMMKVPGMPEPAPQEAPEEAPQH